MLSQNGSDLFPTFRIHSCLNSIYLLNCLAIKKLNTEDIRATVRFPGLIPHSDNVTITILDTAGTLRRVTLKEEPRLSQERWASARAEHGPDVPLYLEDLKSNCWFEYAGDAKLVFLQYNVVR